jgi:hypothetical protein
MQRAAFNFARFTSGQAVRSATEAIVADTRKSLAAATSLRELDRTLTVFYNTLMPIQFLRLTSAHEEVRQAASESQCAMELLELEVASDRRLCGMVRSTRVEDDGGEAARARELYLVDFELKGGAALSEEAHQELKRMKNRLVELQGQYSKNLADDATRVEFARDELVGLEDDFINSLEQTADGRRVVTLRYPHLNPVLQLATKEETRKKMWIASCHKGVPANLTLLPEIVSLRQRLAELLLGPGHSDADLAVARGRRMAGETVEEVAGFLDRMDAMLRDKAAAELKDLHDIKASRFAEFLFLKIFFKREPRSSIRGIWRFWATCGRSKSTTWTTSASRSSSRSSTSWRACSRATPRFWACDLNATPKPRRSRGTPTCRPTRRLTRRQTGCLRGFIWTCIRARASTRTLRAGGWGREARKKARFPSCAWSRISLKRLPLGRLCCASLRSRLEVPFIFSFFSYRIPDIIPRVWTRVPRVSVQQFVPAAQLDLADGGDGLSRSAEHVL